MLIKSTQENLKCYLNLHRKIKKNLTNQHGIFQPDLKLLKTGFIHIQHPK